MKRPSFLERLTGALNANDIDDAFENEHEFSSHEDEEIEMFREDSDWPERESTPEPPEGELPIDMYQTGDNIIIRALVAGVDPDDLDIAITRDMVTIRGQREEYRESSSDDYFHQELFWGSFTRSVLLPEEIVIDESEAREKHGLLEIVLPKVDKDRSTQLKVQTK